MLCICAASFEVRMILRMPNHGKEMASKVQVGERPVAWL